MGNGKSGRAVHMRAKEREKNLLCCFFATMFVFVVAVFDSKATEEKNATAAAVGILPFCVHSLSELRDQ